MNFQCPVLDILAFHLDEVSMEANASWEQLTWGRQQVTEANPWWSSISQRAPIWLQNRLGCKREAGQVHGQRDHRWKPLCGLLPEKCFVRSRVVQKKQNLEEEGQSCLTRLPSQSITVLPGYQGVMETSSPGPITSTKVSPGKCLLGSCMLTTGERLLYSRQTPNHCFPLQNFNISAC